ncbi:MAG TPA: thioredoxin domain-containing protein [Polyangiaceae bacterium]|nr:thioredoxin domain-containing protein [Polyangiaceae bacterium]
MSVRAAITCIGLSSCACGATAPALAPTTVVPQAAAATAGREEALSEEGAAVPISLSNPTRGSRTALVTIVEFADFECPFCARAEEALAEVREMYGPDAVRIVWKNSPLPFHPNASSAAEAAAGVFAMAGADSFWKFHDAALRASSSLGPQAYDQWAKEAGVVDLVAFRAGLANHLWAPGVSKDLGEGKALGVLGTPTFFVNGLPLAGALPFPTFRNAIDEQVRLAQSRVAAGTPRERLYADLARDNRAREPEKGDDSDDRVESKTVYRVPVGTSPVRGSASALVTLIEFADYECAFCIRAEATLKALREGYGDKLRVVFKDAPLPFHPRAEPAAEAALEVRAEKGDAAFWAMHDELLAGSADLEDDALVQLATRFGARAEAVKAAIANHSRHKSIDDDADLADDFEANGTPHFFINGRRLVGAQPKERFEEVIEEEIRRAQGMLEGGTKPQALYEALLRDGKGAVEPEKKTLPAAFPGHDPARGNPAAKVTVHEWSDFQCPFCKRAQPTLQQIAREYGARVKIVWHDLPLSMHADAPLAARAAREALAQKGERAFWAIHDQLFAHQQELKREDLDGYARQAGLDMGKWKAALDGNAHQGQIDIDGEAAADMDITGTPAFVIVAAGANSGYFLSGSQGYAKFRRLIERALTEAK